MKKTIVLTKSLLEEMLRYMNEFNHTALIVHVVEIEGEKEGDLYLGEWKWKDEKGKVY